MSYRVFDRLWSRYDSWYERHAITAANELLAVRASLRGAPRPCVEVGVGTGWFAAGAGCRFGVDPSRGMLRAAVGRGLLVVQGRGESLPLAFARFGSVLIVVTLCFVEDPLRVLAEARRVVFDGGVVVSCIVPRDSEWGRYYADLARAGHPFYSVARFYTVEEVESFLAQTGFRVERRVATLSYGPLDPERPEEPWEYRGGEGFVCIRGRAVTGLERA